MLKIIQICKETFTVIALKVWAFICILIKRQIKSVRQYQPVKYRVFPLSPLSRHRLSMVRRKVLVLDLDETLVHSLFIHSHHEDFSRHASISKMPPDFIINVNIEQNPVKFFVYKRPHVDYFLNAVSKLYELVVFTAGVQVYGAAVANELDNSRDLLRRRFYRQHCTLEMGSYTKDLTSISNDLSSIFILDNSPAAYRAFPYNSIPIKSWFSDPSDSALLNLLPMLDALRFTDDVRSVLSRNLHNHDLLK